MILRPFQISPFFSNLLRQFCKFLSDFSRFHGMNLNEADFANSRQMLMELLRKFTEVFELCRFFMGVNENDSEMIAICQRILRKDLSTI